MAKVSGAKQHTAHLKRIRGATMTKEIGKAIYVSADALATDAALSITAGSISGKGHIASKPGEPPNADTQVLNRSIEATKTGPLTAETSANAPYATALEFGTSKMPARPYMKPAAERTRPKAVALVRKAVSRVVNKGSL